MNHFFVCLTHANILRTPYPTQENIFLRRFFAQIFNFDALHSPKYAKSTYSMNQFFVPTHNIYILNYFPRSWVQKNFQLLFVLNHSQGHISESKSPILRGLLPNDSQVL